VRTLHDSAAVQQGVHEGALEQAQACVQAHCSQQQGQGSGQVGAYLKGSMCYSRRQSFNLLAASRMLLHMSVL
jgi:hypothetical protein